MIDMYQNYESIWFWFQKYVTIKDAPSNKVAQKSISWSRLVVGKKLILLIYSDGKRFWTVAVSNWSLQL